MPYPTFPSKLYGREGSTQELLDYFSLGQEAGIPQMFLVVGAAGVGKSAIVRDFLSKADRNVRCIWGGGDQFQQAVPYYTARSAFSHLVQQLQSSTQRHHWREKLLAALGVNAQVMIDVIPELERIIGPQLPVPALGPIESQNRFNLVFQTFVRVFCSQEHPLVIFLDDLQWADAASLKLIQLLMSDDEMGYLLLIGAYRDNEVNPNHLLTATIETLQSAGRTLQRLHLAPLSDRQVNQFVLDTLQDWLGPSRPLSAPVGYQANGNPLHLKQLLNSLYLENQKVSETDRKIWRWHFESIPNHDFRGLIARDLAKLPPQTQHLLKRAACIGSQVPLETLSAITDVSAAKTLEQLREALDIQFICLDRETPEPTVRFSHDRIQQAIYNSIQPTTRTAMHLATGRLMMANATAEEPENLFVAVNQLNLGSCLLSKNKEKDDLAALNLRTAKQAKSLTDFQSALNYINQGLDLINDAWERNYDLVLDLHKLAIEAESMNQNFDRSHALAEVAFRHSKSLIEKAEINTLRVRAYTAQGSFGEAIELGCHTLETLQVDLVREPPSLLVDDFMNLPEMADSLKIAVIRLLDSLGDAAFIANLNLYKFTVFTQIYLFGNYGNLPISAVSFGNYALILSGVLGKIEVGYQFGKASLKLLKKLDAKQYWTDIHEIFNGHVRHWKEPLSASLELLREAFYEGLKNGKIDFSGYSILCYFTGILFSGKSLDFVREEHELFLRILRKSHFEYHISYASISLQFTLNLIRINEDNLILSGRVFDEAVMVPALEEQQNGTALFYLYLAKAVLAYLFNQPELAIVHAREAAKYEQSSSGLYIVSVNVFFLLLSLLTYYPVSPKSERPGTIEQIRFYLKRLAKWARHAPMNFQHKYDLVAALLAWITGKQERSKQLFRQAIAGARENGYIQEEALAHELAGRFYLALDQREVAAQHLSAGYAGFQKWGALAVAARMERDYDCLQSSNLNADFAQAIVNKLTEGIPTLRYAFLRATVQYDAATQRIIIAAKTRSNAALIAQFLPLLRGKKLAEVILEIPD